MDIYAKQLELLARAVPHVRRVAMPQTRPIRTMQSGWPKSSVRAGSLGVQLQFVATRSVGDLDDGFAAMSKGAPGGPAGRDPFDILDPWRTAGRARSQAWASVTGHRELVVAGGLLS